MLLSTTARSFGERNDLDSFFAFLEKVTESEFQEVHLAFAELTGLLKENFDTKSFARRFHETGLFAHAAHAPMFYPFVYPKTDGKEWEIEMMISLEAAAACGVTAFVMHLGTVVDDHGHYLRAPSIEKNIAYLQPYLKKAMELGVTIAIENGTNQPWPGQEQKLVDVSPDFDELMEVVDALNKEFGQEVLGICFDCGHANVGHLDLPAEIEKIGSRLKVVHIHDNDGNFDQHLLPFEGNIDWSGVMAALKKIGFDGELALELYYEQDGLQKDLVAYLNHTFHILSKLLD